MEADGHRQSSPGGPRGSIMGSNQPSAQRHHKSYSSAFRTPSQSQCIPSNTTTRRPLHQQWVFSPGSITHPIILSSKCETTSTGPRANRCRSRTAAARDTAPTNGKTASRHYKDSFRATRPFNTPSEHARLRPGSQSSLVSRNKSTPSKPQRHQLPRTTIPPTAIQPTRALPEQQQ